VEDEYPVEVTLDGGQVVGDHQQGPCRSRGDSTLAQCTPDEMLGVAVEGGGGLVEDEHPVGPDQLPSDAHTLSLTSEQGIPTVLTDNDAF